MPNDSLHRQWPWSGNIMQSNPCTCWALFFAFPARAFKEDPHAPHPLVESSHRVLFGGVHCG